MRHLGRFGRALLPGDRLQRLTPHCAWRWPPSSARKPPILRTRRLWVGDLRCRTPCRRRCRKWRRSNCWRSRRPSPDSTFTVLEAAVDAIDGAERIILYGLAPAGSSRRISPTSSSASDGRAYSRRSARGRRRLRAADRIDRRDRLLPLGFDARNRAVPGDGAYQWRPPRSPSRRRRTPPSPARPITRSHGGARVDLPRGRHGEPHRACSRSILVDCLFLGVRQAPVHAETVDALQRTGQATRALRG